MPEEITLSRPPRRSYTPEFRAQVVAECAVPGTSVSGIALSYGLNANMVRRWCSKARQGQMLATRPTAAFVAVDMDHSPKDRAAPMAATGIEVQIQRGIVQARISWPVHASHDCAAWLRELLR